MPGALPPARLGVRAAASGADRAGFVLARGGVSRRTPSSAPTRPPGDLPRRLILERIRFRTCSARGHDATLLLSSRRRSATRRSRPSSRPSARAGSPTGPRAELERRFAEYVGARHAVTVASGTAALHLALPGRRDRPGDEVITTPITWPATANVVVHAGRDAGLRDVEGGRPQHRPRPRRRGDHAADEGGHAGAPRGPAGRPRSTARARRPGDRGRDARDRVVLPRRKIGSIEGSLAAAFSLNATKNVAGAEGGILTTDDDDLAAAVKELRLMRRRSGALYDIRVAGFKANLPDLLAALALVQLEKVERARRDPPAARRRLRRRGRRAARDRAARPRRARRPRAPHLRRPDRRRARGRRPECLPRGARGREHRHVNPLPPAPPAHLLPRALPRASRRFRSPSAPATRCSRCRSRPRTRTRTSRTPSTRSGACTPASRAPEAARAETPDVRSRS